jgi:hypothetical protein
VKLVVLIAAYLACSAGIAVAQEDTWVGQNNGPQLRVTLPNKNDYLKNRALRVEVAVQNVGLADPSSYSVSGSGHVDYRIDDCPSLHMIATKMTFRDLKPGTHALTVQLVDNADRPEGATAKITVTVQ